VNSGPAYDAQTRARRDAATGIALALVLASLSMVVADALSSERRVLLFFTSHRGHWSVDAAKTVTVVGDGPILLVLSLLAAIALWLWKRRGALALSPFVALLVARLVTRIGKAAIGRARPPVALHLIAESGNSTPSGHATEATALFVALALVIAMLAWREPIVGRVASALAVLLAIGIGLSRVELGVHWPLDLVAGWLLGLGAAVAVVELGAAIDSRTKKDQVVLV
jgi:membrane-associated phospholipid phosphatase